MKKHVYFSCLIMVSFIIAACQVVISTPTIPAEVTEDQGQKATLELLLTQQAATIESLTTLVAPTPSPIPTETAVVPEVTVLPLYTGDFIVIESGGLVFNLPVEVATSAEVTNVLPDDPNDGWPELALPARRKIDFSGYVIQNHFHAPAVYVYPLEKILAAGLFGATTATNLLALLDDPAADLQTADNLPFLPPFNAAQVFHVLENRIESEHGRGIRFLTLYSQGIVGVTNYEIFYTYQGLSADGRYYIAAVLPINSSLLPDTQLSNEELDAIVNEYPDYIEDMIAMIRTENGGVITPSLEALDAMMLSFTIVN
jgi:hypothetical protein